MLFCSDCKKVSIASARDYSEGYHKSMDSAVNVSDREKLERNISDNPNFQNVSVYGNKYAMVLNQTNPGRYIFICHC